ncbi:hypothetical protein Hanom_Chr09g00816391 [Helianthus anomalus]
MKKLKTLEVDFQHFRSTISSLSFPNFSDLDRASKFSHSINDDIKKTASKLSHSVWFLYFGFARGGKMGGLVNVSKWVCGSPVCGLIIFHEVEHLDMLIRESESQKHRYRVKSIHMRPSVATAWSNAKDISYFDFILTP